MSEMVEPKGSMSTSSSNDNIVQNFEKRMDELADRSIKKIEKMPLKELLKHPVVQFDKKRIFEEALGVAIQAGLSPKKQTKITPSSYQLRVHYSTNFGQDVFVVGSSEALGKWDAEKKAMPMSWSEGHIWFAEFPLESIETPFEFKFVIKEKGKVSRWEGGVNHVYDLHKYTQMLNNPVLLKKIEEGNYDVVELATDNEIVGYNRKSKVLHVQGYWQ